MNSANRSESNGGELSQSEVEGRFADLVSSNFTDELAPGAALTAAPVEASAASRIASADATAIVSRIYGPRDWPTTPEVEALEDAQSRFHQPNPTGVFKTADPVRRAATIGAVLFPILTVIAFVLRVAFGTRAWPIWPGPLFAALFLLSLVILLWRMPKDRPYRHDGGAVV
ncbi:MAG: hypothetical protein LBB58_04145 [Cellulomonadaceae bacterium]|jgi:hypothetical protein|nr:hypothetical protein [Cellulomonadaceae bacterium]